MGPASPPGALAQARSTLQQQHQPAAKAVRTAAPGATIPEVTIPKGSSVTLKAASTGAVSYQWFRDGEVIDGALRSEEHTSELQSLMRISYAVFCLKKKKNTKETNS